MKNRIEHFTSLGTNQLMEINGGGFAFDVGRVLRYIVLSGGGLSSIGIANATGDWIINESQSS